MALIASGFVHRGAIDAAVRNVEDAFSSQVVRIGYSFGEDQTESPAIFFASSFVMRLRLSRTSEGLRKAWPTLRRAVSTAYYALFHFLIEETCRDWARPEQRSKPARLFDHKIMFGASNRRVEEHRKALAGSPEFHLYLPAFAFCQLQSNRHDADYDVSKSYSSSDVALDLNRAEEAFKSWGIIRDRQIGQDYLFSLLFKARA